MTTAYLFPGQGSQFVGMGRDLYERHPAARALYDSADSILGFALSALCFDGPEAALTDTVNQQPALFVTSLAAWAVIQTDGDWPAADYLAGHSLGEITALAAAESIAFADGLRLVRRRGELMQRAGELAPGGMMAVLGLDAATTTALCAEAAARTGQPVQLANDNCPGQLVISGDTTALTLAGELAQAAGARKVVALPVTVAAHSALMASVEAEYAAVVDAIPVNQPRIPVISNLTAEPLPSPRMIRHELRRQLVSPVRWTESMLMLRGRGVDTFAEVGPGDVLTKLMRRIDRSATRRAFGPAGGDGEQPA